MPSTLTVPIKTPEDTNIQALQDRLKDTQELKKHAESAFVEACNAVEVAEARAADNEIMMATIKKVYKYAKISFLKARLQVEKVEASLEEAKKGEGNIHVSIPEGDRKPAAVTAPTGEVTNLDRAGTEVVTGDLEKEEEAIIADNDDGVEALTARVGNEQSRNEAPAAGWPNDGLLESNGGEEADENQAASTIVENESDHELDDSNEDGVQGSIIIPGKASGKKKRAAVHENQDKKVSAKKSRAQPIEDEPPGELTVVGCGASELNGIYKRDDVVAGIYWKRGVWQGKDVNFIIGPDKHIWTIVAQTDCVTKINKQESATESGRCFLVMLTLML